MAELRMFKRKIKTIVVFLICLFLLNCPKEEKNNISENDTVECENIEENINNGSKVKNGEKVAIRAIWNFEKERISYINSETKILAIGGQPLQINKIQGLEQLKHVKNLYLFDINDDFSDVTNSIKALKDTVETIVFESCYLNDIDFLKEFKRLKAIIFSNTDINNTSTFDFEENKCLEYFYFYSGLIKGHMMRLVGLGYGPRPIEEYTEEEKEYLTVKIIPSKRMMFICFDTNFYPIIIKEELLKKLENVKKIVIAEKAFKLGKNDINLLRKYKNIFILDFENVREIDTDVPEEYRFEKLTDINLYRDEVIGVL